MGGKPRYLDWQHANPRKKGEPMKKQALKAQVSGETPMVEVKPNRHLTVQTGIKAGSHQSSPNIGVGKG
jgi:hypothetical protein